MAQICYTARDGKTIAIQNPTPEQWTEGCSTIAENILALAGVGSGPRQPFDLELKANDRPLES